MKTFDPPLEALVGRGVTSVPVSNWPAGPGGVMTMMRGTPATTAGIVVIMTTLGKEPLPRGT